MLKKNDKVMYKDRSTYLVGKTISDPYIMVTEKRKYIDVYYENEDLQVPIPIDLLEKID